jgi:hypothetical protein
VAGALSCRFFSCFWCWLLLFCFVISLLAVCLFCWLYLGAFALLYRLLSLHWYILYHCAELVFNKILHFAAKKKDVIDSINMYFF